MAFRAALRFAAPLGFPKRGKEVSRLSEPDGLVREGLPFIFLSFVLIVATVGFPPQEVLVTSRHLLCFLL